MSHNEDSKKGVLVPEVRFLRASLIRAFMN